MTSECHAACLQNKHDHDMDVSKNRGGKAPQIIPLFIGFSMK